MKFNLLLFQFFLSFLMPGAAQKVNIDFKLVDNKFEDPSNYVFAVTVQNVQFESYWIQDTSYLKSEVEYPDANLIYPHLWRKTGGKYMLYENYKHRPGTLRPKCMDSCCNC